MCNRDTPGRARRRVPVDPLAWNGVRQGRGLESSGTCVGVLITRRSQVQILPPLPTSSQVSNGEPPRRLAVAREDSASRAVWRVVWSQATHG